MNFDCKTLAGWMLPCACLLNPFLAFGQDEDSSFLDEVVVTATRIPMEWTRETPTQRGRVYVRPGLPAMRTASSRPALA